MNTCKSIVLLAVLLALPLMGFSQERLRFGITNAYPPYILSNKIGHYPAGINVEIAEAVCKQFPQRKCTFVQLPLNKLYESLTNNQVDAIMPIIALDDGKKKFFDYTQPYMTPTMIFLVNTKSKLIPTTKTLEGHRVGVMNDSYFFTYINTHFPGAKIVTFDNANQLMTALTSQKIDAILLDILAANYWETFNRGEIKKAGSEIMNGNDGLRIIVKKGNIKFVNQLNEALTKINTKAIIANILKSYGAS